VRALTFAALAAVTLGHGSAYAQPRPEGPPQAFAALDQACSDAFVTALSAPVKVLVDTQGLSDGERADRYGKIFDAASVPPACREAQSMLFQYAIGPRSNDLALSFDAPASNPSSLALVERGGTIKDVAMALRNNSFFSADDTAVTLHLNAASAFCNDEKNPDCAWDRLTGGVTFGTKIPEKEIVGFSGIPDPDRLLDVVVWDANLRLIGDRRPGSRKWRREWDAMAVDGWVRLKPVNTRLFPPELSDAKLAQEGGLMISAINARAAHDVRDLQDRIASSLLVTVGFSGQHLTAEPGQNKFTAKLTVDKGLGKWVGNAGFTFNASYSSVHDVPAGSGLPVTLKTWHLAAGFSGDFMKNVLVKDRSTEWNLSGKLDLPADGAEVTVDRNNVYEAALAFRFPVTQTSHVPIVVTFTNDPNSLAKQRYVRGQVGIDFDFGALKNIFK
jgi:hypothetical protein